VDEATVREHDEFMAKLPSAAAANDVAPRLKSDDPRIERVVSLMHGDLKSPWTVEGLARAAGMSRATLARRFVEEKGEPPLRLLTRLRMERARELLTTTDRRIAEIAPEVGYDCEFAFNRAFRRHFGTAPGRYRRTFAGVGRTPTRMAA
jgi:transcriptional regulator GlxA family with amidase domain